MFAYGSWRKKGVVVSARTGQVSGPSPPKPVSSFTHLSLDEGLLKVIWEMEYTQPTPIQAQVVPAALLGLDVFGIAKTGAGKTCAFIWPMINHIIVKSELASLTKNFSVFELAALVQAAFSWRLFRSIKILTKEEDEFETFPDIDNVSVTRDDFFDVLLEPDKVEVEFEIDQDDVNNILTMEDFKDALDHDVKPIRLNLVLALNPFLKELASLTKNFSVFELAALVQAAFSWRLFRSIKILTKEEDEFETFPDIDNVSVTRDDFFDVLLEPDKVEVEFEIDQDDVNNILTMEDFKDALDHDVKP
ncbi:hypothetical protein QYM36_016408, partial [Artemia franciscana]